MILKKAKEKSINSIDSFPPSQTIEFQFLTTFFLSFYNIFLFLKNVIYNTILITQKKSLKIPSNSLEIFDFLKKHF